MKKINTIFAIVMTALMLSVTASAKEIDVSGLGTGVQEISEYYVGKTESAFKLKKNQTIKDTLVIPENETLVIPEGCTLSLYGGCKVDGILFIENGAKLLVKKQKLEISGKLINDGYTFFGSKSKLAVKDGGMLYSSAEGKITVKTENLSLSEYSSVVCLGKGSFSTAENVFSPSVAGAVKISVGTGGLSNIYDTQIIPPDEALAIAKSDIVCMGETSFGGSTNMAVLFDNGCTIRYWLTPENDSYLIFGIS